MVAIRAVRGLLRWMWRFATLLVFVGMLSLLVTTLTVASVNAFVTGALTAVTGAQTVAGKLRADKSRLVRAARGHFRHAAANRRATQANLAAAGLARKQAVQTLRKSRVRISRRMSRALASTPTKAIPVAGAAVVLTMTVAELAAACEEVVEIERALEGDSTPAAIDQGQREFQEFCDQNEAALARINKEAEPILERFNDAGAHVWASASDVIRRAEEAAQSAHGISVGFRGLISNACEVTPDWIC